MKSYTAKPSEITNNWYVIDAADIVLGRMSAIVAKMLRGKHKPIFTPHMDCGDNIIIVNSDKVFLTGKKWKEKKYYWHTGFPGGIKERNAQQIKEGKNPTNVIKKSIERMLPGGPLSRKQMTRLYIYTGNEHPHEAQKPVKLDIAAMNNKNSKA